MIERILHSRAFIADALPCDTPVRHGQAHCKTRPFPRNVTLEDNLTGDTNGKRTKPIYPTPDSCTGAAN
jgi:hypothetical protein